MPDTAFNTFFTKMCQVSEAMLFLKYVDYNVILVDCRFLKSENVSYSP